MSRGTINIVVQWGAAVTQWLEFTICTQQVMIAQWDSSLSVLPVARVRFPATAEYFKGFFPG